MTIPRGQSPSTSQALDANTKILRRRFPRLATFIESYAEQPPGTVCAQATRSGLPTISVESGTATVHAHSTFQPVVEAQRWVKEPLSQDWDVAIVFGLGLGYHLDELLEQRPQCRLIVIEPRLDVFYAAMACKDQRRLLTHPKLELIVTDDPVAAAQALLQRHLKELLGQTSVFVWPAAVRYASDYWKTFESQLVDMLRAVRSDNATRSTYQRQWIENFFENVRFAAGDPGVAALKDKLAGVPAVVVASGPSLEKNVHLLAEAKSKAVIIAAGSAINPLLKHGIEPDLLVSGDAGRANYRHFKDLNAPGVPLVYVPIIFPRILKEYPGPRFTVGMDVLPFIGWVFRQLDQEKGTLASGPSVANLAWHLATVLGLNPIILIGQDLAFTDGKTHAAGTATAKTVEIKSADGQSRFIITEGIDGLPVTTSYAMYSMKVWFEQRLMNVSSGRVTIDATEGGAKIAGTTIMSLREALEKYCRESFDIRQTIISVYSEESQRLRDVDLVQRLRNIYSDLSQQLLLVTRLVKDGLAAANSLRRESTTKKLTEQRYKEAATRLARYRRGLFAIPVYEMFIEPATMHVIRSIAWLMQARQEKETDLFGNAAEVAQQHVTLFTTTRDMARQIQRLLDERIKLQSAVVSNPPLRSR